MKTLSGIFLFSLQAAAFTCLNVPSVIHSRKSLTRKARHYKPGIESLREASSSLVAISSRLYEYSHGTEPVPDNRKQALDRLLQSLASRSEYMLAKKIVSIEDTDLLKAIFLNSYEFSARIRKLAFDQLYPQQEGHPILLSQRVVCLKAISGEQLFSLSMDKDGVMTLPLNSPNGKALFRQLKDTGHQYGLPEQLPSGDNFFTSPLYFCMKDYFSNHFSGKKVEVVTEPIFRAANAPGLDLHIDTGDALASLQDIVQKGNPDFLCFTTAFPSTGKAYQTLKKAVDHPNESRITLYNAWFLIKSHSKNFHSLAVFAPKTQSSLAAVASDYSKPSFVGEGSAINTLFPKDQLHHCFSLENHPGESVLIFPTQGTPHASVDRDHNNVALLNESLNQPIPREAVLRNSIWRVSVDVRFAVWEPL